jgi:predicted TIM-barrel fold metal-dependent hydrolase
MAITRREWIAVALAPSLASSGSVLIDAHVHLFAGDPVRFPYSPAAYKPKPLPVEAYVQFAREARIQHAVIVHPEPYQDDHRYLEYCFAHELTKGFFKGTCLFDPVDPETPKRMMALVKRNPGRIVALRIHETHAAGTPPTISGAIRDRNLRDPQMKQSWRAAHQLGLAIQMHLIPHYAPQVRELAASFPKMPVILDHLARPGEGTAAEYDEVLRLADLPLVYMKFSNTGVTSASKQPYPHLDAKPIVQRALKSFGADRMLWGELGSNMAEFAKAEKLFNLMFDFASEPDRDQIRGLTARKLFAFA